MLVDVSKVGNVSEVGDPAAFDGHKQLMWFHPENIRKIKQLTTKGTRRSGDGLPYTLAPSCRHSLIISLSSVRNEAFAKFYSLQIVNGCFTPGVLTAEPTLSIDEHQPEHLRSLRGKNVRYCKIFNWHVYIYISFLHYYLVLIIKIHLNIACTKNIFIHTIHTHVNYSFIYFLTRRFYSLSVLVR